MDTNTIISFDPLLPKEKEIIDNESIIKDQTKLQEKPKKSIMQKLNTFMIDNYSLIIIFSFALTFILIPFIIFHIKRARYSHLFRDDSDKILQPINEARDFRWIQLNNDLNVLLISDSELINSGAALEIDVGSSYDPKEIPGLAHFLEHMLFMGSKKYHNVSHFKDFITLNGGKTNAFTSDDYTKFYFTVNNGELDSALEIFSRFFIDPLFDNNRIEKEILAVHNEYEMNLQKNLWRFFELLRRNSNSNHSFHRFTCGNLKTLKIMPEKNHLKIQEEVQKFYKNYYSSHKMKLVVIGDYKLDSLEKMVVDKFTQIKNKKSNYHMPVHLVNMPPAYPQNLLGKFIWYRTIGNQKLISIVFPLKIDKKIDPKVNPLNYLNSVITMEGEYSLKWNLMKKGWISSLDTNIIQKTPDFIHFAVMIGLTDKGIMNSLEIIEIFFSWIKLILKDGVNRKIYKQLSAISYLNFLFSKKKSLEDDLITLVSNLNELSNSNIPFENILVHKEVLMKYNGSSIREILNDFKPENSLIVLGAGDLEIEKIMTTDRFKTDFNETGEEMLINFKEKDFFWDEAFDFDKEIFQNLRVFSKKTLEDIPKKYLLKPNKINNFSNNFVSFKESILIDKNQILFDELMEETFTFCDYKSGDPYEFKINSNLNDYDFFTGTTEMREDQEIFGKGNFIKCSVDYNDSLLYYKKLNKFDEIMKIHYSTEPINSTLLNQMDKTNYSLFHHFDFKIPNRFVPLNYDLKSNCSPEDAKKISSKDNNNSFVNNIKIKANKHDFSNAMKDLIDDFDQKEFSNQIQSHCFFDELMKDLTNEYPIKIAQNLSKSNIWLKTDRTFLMPKTDIKIFIRINDIDSEKDKVILGIIIDIINGRIKEMLYDAALLKYKANLLAHQKGIEFQINGFSDKLGLLVQTVFEHFCSFFEKMTEEQFQNHVSDIRIFYENLNKAQSLQQLQKYLNKILRKNYLSNKEILKYLEEVSLEDVKKFIEKMFKNYELNILFVGNILPEEATELSYNITNIFLSKYYLNNVQKKSTLQNTSILNISRKFNSVFQTNNSNLDDENNAIINYYQIGKRNDLDYVKSVVISTLLNTECFNFLRTEKQLGYVVHSNIFSLKNVDGFTIGIQGSNNPPDLMNKYIEEFLFRFYEIISNKSETQFHNIFTHVANNFLFKDADISSLSDRLWEEICFGKKDFEKFDRYYKQIINLTKNDILEFFQQIFKIENKKISLQLSKNNSIDTQNRLLLNLTENYGNREEKLMSLEDLTTWDYYQILE